MKYPCNLIQDLLPLYHDGVCSEESAKIVEEHLSECTTCRHYYAVLNESEPIVVAPENPEQEMKKAVSYRNVKKKLLKKQICIAAITFFVIAVMIFSAIALLKNSKHVISYEDNISVSMVDDCLIGRLNGNQAEYLKIKRVEVNTDGQVNTYLFFSMSGSEWDDIVTNDNVFSEYVLCSADKGAAQVDGVFYYTGDYTDIESMSAEELQKVIDQSVLLWNK